MENMGSIQLVVNILTTLTMSHLKNITDFGGA
jgi:hypothetical protein